MSTHADRPVDREPIPGGVWVTKYALTNGIHFYENAVRLLDVQQTDTGWKVTPSDTVGVCSPRPYIFSDDRIKFIGKGRTWHLSEAEAIAQAKKMVAAKKRSVEKMLNKLKNLDEIAIRVSSPETP